METAGVFIVLQCLANYLLLAYPVDAASLLAGNDLMRSFLAAAGILFSGPMYDGLGVKAGVSLLAGLTVVCVGGMIVLYSFGHKWRTDVEDVVQADE